MPGRAGIALPLLLLLAVLAACEQTGGSTQASVTLPPLPPGGEDAPLTAAERAAVPADLVNNPARLNGLSGRVVRAALGTPDFRRREKDNAEIWHYYGEGCVLHLFSYLENGRRVVTHHEIKGTTGPAPAKCYRGIVESRRKAQGV